MLHHLDEWLGKKKLLVAFSSWCGCRYDLPGWQALHDELSPEGFTVIAVAIDQAADDVRPLTDGITMPVLYDPHHLLTELYAISNVPTVVWIDEQDRIARPNGVPSAAICSPTSPGSSPVPTWTRCAGGSGRGSARRPGRGPGGGGRPVRRRGVGPAALPGGRRGPPPGRGGGHPASRDLASALAPDDLTIWRAGMPLVGEDPFGDDFLARYEEWKQRGMPYHGLPAVGGAEPVAR